jgi:hypothetical protein
MGTSRLRGGELQAESRGGEGTAGGIEDGLAMAPRGECVRRTVEGTSEDISS